MSRHAYRADIDGLRALAVLPVMLNHADLALPGGFAGVDVFFVISGYLITRIIDAELREGRFSFAVFYERRARRLFPALALVLAVTTAAAAWRMLPEDFEAYARSLAATVAFISNIHFYLEVDYFGQAAALKPLLHTWSLAVEEQFYLVFPPALWLVWRFRLGAWAWMGVLVVAAASLWLADRWTWGTEAGFYLPQPRAWELLVGALLALAPIPRLPKVVRELLGLGGLAVLAWVFIAYSKAMPFPGLNALAPCLAAAAIILAGDDQTTASARILRAGPLVWIGRLSYSLYLWHWPVLVFARYGRLEPLGAVEAASCLVLSAALAAATYVWVEQPFRTGRVLPTRRSMFGAGVAAFAALLAVAGAAIVTQGFPGRATPELLASYQVEAPEDLSAIECAPDFPIQRPEGGLCRYGAPDAPADFILIGDSHASVLSYGLFHHAALLGRSGWRFARGGVRPLPEMWRLVDGGEPADVAAAYRALDARPELRTIVLTAYWSNWVIGSNYSGGNTVLVDAGYDGSLKRYNPRALLNGLLRLADRYPDRRIVVLDDVPTGATFEPARLRATSFASRRNVPGGVDKAEAREEADTYAHLLRDAASRRPNLEFHPVLMEAICNAQGRCPMLSEEGEPLYFDGNHLSLQGSLKVAPAVIRVLNWDVRG